MGAFAILAVSLPAGRPGGSVLAAIGSPAFVGASSADTARVAGSATGASAVSLAPIVEGLSLTSSLGRPANRAAQPQARAIFRGFGGGKAVFLGDSYTTGWNGAGMGARGWPRIVGAAEGWRTVNLAVAGTGFINPGWTGQPVSALVGRAISERPDVVFIVAGHNDSRWSSAATGHAADLVINRLKSALPNATIVVIGPIWPSARPPQRCIDLRNHLRWKTQSVGGIFIDPIGEGWFAHNAGLIMSDGIHPTDAGHRRIASRVLANLSRASISR